MRLLRRIAAGVWRRIRGTHRAPPARELFRSGRALERAGRHAAAVDAYRSAIEHHPTRPHWHYRLGRTLERTRHWTDATVAYRTAIDLDATHATWHYRLGRTLERTRAWADAAAAYERAIALDDSNAAWRQRQAAALRRAHDREGLRLAVDAMLAREPDMPEPERRLLADDPRRFDVRRQIMRFVIAHLDEIHEIAATPLEASPQAADRIWVYWAQGIDHAPAVIRLCHAELRRVHAEHEVVVLDQATVDHHSDLPGYVHDRTRDDPTKYSDVLRLDLLARHGGIWLDATCLPRRRLIALLPELVASGVFAPRFRRARMASWLLAATPGDPTMTTLRAAQLIYWRHHDAPIDYFVLHHLFESLFLVDPAVRSAVETMPNVSAHPPSTLARAMLEPYDRDRFRQLLDASFVHKLSHKTPPGRDLRGTMLAHLLEHGVPEAA